MSGYFDMDNDYYYYYAVSLRLAYAMKQAHTRIGNKVAYSTLLHAWTLNPTVLMERRITECVKRCMYISAMLIGAVG